jgi:hypothetical protein
MDELWRSGKVMTEEFQRCRPDPETKRMFRCVVAQPVSCGLVEGSTSALGFQ